jgi:prepilin-type N-terminal cleavage/methylation domain-containing protein
MNNTKRAISEGFTLVELLIVIALIAILSVAVLATINPIEQTNKARDAKFKNNAAEVLGAYERYYASQNAYPWNNGIGTTVAFGTKVAIGSTDPTFGVLGLGDSSGVLITTSELKSSFMGTEPFKTGVVSLDKMYVYHNGLDSNYVCFLPKATANRYSGSSANPNLKCLNMAGAASSLLNLGAGCLAVTNWSTPANLLPSATVANMLCVPEGTIQASP